MDEEKSIEDKILDELKSWRQQNQYGPSPRSDESLDFDWTRHSSFMASRASSLPDFFKESWLKIFEVGYQISDLIESVRKVPTYEYGFSLAVEWAPEILSPLFGMTEPHRQSHNEGLKFASCEDWEDSQGHANHFRLDFARVLMAAGYVDQAEKVLRAMLVPQCTEKLMKPSWRQDSEPTERLAQHREFAIRDLRNIQAMKGDLSNALTFDALLPPDLRWPEGAMRQYSTGLSGEGDGGNITFFPRD